ncbi:MAG TPA: hypothetical protein VF754_03625 [Pyrinomonadaceae bacterium]
MLAVAAVAPDVNFTIILPELILSLAGVVVMMVDAFTRRAAQRWVTGALSLVGLAAAAVSCVWLWGRAMRRGRRPSTA